MITRGRFAQLLQNILYALFSLALSFIIFFDHFWNYLIFMLRCYFNFLLVISYLINNFAITLYQHRLLRSNFKIKVFRKRYLKCIKFYQEYWKLGNRGVELSLVYYNVFISFQIILSNKRTCYSYHVNYFSQLKHQNILAQDQWVEVFLLIINWNIESSSFYWLSYNIHRTLNRSMYSIFKVNRSVRQIKNNEW